MLVGLSIAETVSWGVVYYAFSVFLRPMEQEFGWSRSAVTGAFSVALLVSGLAAVPVGRWLDANGARAVMTMGSILAALMLIAWSRVESLGGLYAVWAGLGVAMATVLYEPAFAVVATWFDRQRDRAFTILTLFGGLASTIFVPLAASLLETQGWRAAVVSLALVLAGTTVPLHALLLRRPPSKLAVEGLAQSRSRGPAVLSNRSFWELTAAFVASSLAAVGVGVHLLPCLLERGLRPRSAAAIVAAMGFAQLPGRLLHVVIRKRLRAGQTIVAMLTMQAVVLGALPWSGNGPSLLALVLVFGMCSGMSTLLRASALADVFGARIYGRVSGTLSTFTTFARAAAPFGTALVYGHFGSYTAVFVGLATVLAATALGIGRATRRTMPSRLGEVPECSRA